MSLVASDITSNIGASVKPHFQEYPERRTFDVFLFLMPYIGPTVSQPERQCIANRLGTIAACSLAVAEILVHILSLLVDCIVILQVIPCSQ